MGNTKYDRGNGIHGVPIWRIAGFALNNLASNVYIMMMSFLTYYLVGFVGVAVMVASSFSMGMRIWDGVTDPIVGFLLDKTNGKFGKNRPFMVVGNALMLVTSFILFHVTHKLPDNTILRFTFFIIVAAFYYIGYTCQCVVTKSAQSCLTNDPKQRPLFSMFDAAYGTFMYIAFQMYSVYLADKYGSFYEEGLFHEMWLTVAIISAILTILAVISIAPKDRIEYFGVGKPIKIGIKDYIDCLKHNKAIQMLVLAASSDKLASSAKTSTVTLIMFGIVAGNYSLNGSLSAMTSIPTILISMFCIGTIATKLGQRKAMLIGSYGGLLVNAMLICLWLFGDPTTMSNADGEINWGYFAIAYIVLTIIQGGLNGITGNIVIPMTADCADYEVYRSGKYVPGMMGTLFSFIDKIVSSVAPMITGVLLAMIGFGEVLPDIDTPYSPALHYVGVFCMYGMIMVGLVCNIIAMKHYPLTKEKMEEIQGEIAAIKAKEMGE